MLELQQELVDREWVKMIDYDIMEHVKDEAKRYFQDKYGIEGCKPFVQKSSERSKD